MERTVLISGAGRGLGALTALAFGRAGYGVFAGVRSAESGVALQQRARDHGIDVEPVALDVCDDGSVLRAVDEVVARGHRLDVLVANAGIGAAGSVEFTPDATARAIFETNTFGFLRLVRAALPVMRRQQAGTIIGLTSLMGEVPTPGMGVYAASKQAQTALVEALSLEVEPFGIRVTCIEPGPYRTVIAAEMNGSSAPPTPYDPLLQALQDRGRRRLAESGDPEEVARAIVAAAQADRPELHIPVGRHAIAALANDSARATTWLDALRSELRHA
jgi:NAD(P)-dependent dehydrogenase (short-subunit alcohol dehydrogenase family)